MRSIGQKKLLYISVHDPHVPLTGSGARVGAFVNYLGSRYHLDLVYLDGSGQPPVPELSRKFASRVSGLASKTCVPYSQAGYFLFSPQLYREAKKRLQAERYDFIICDYGLSALYGLLLAHKFNTPFIYLSHNIEFRQYMGKIGRDIRRLPLGVYMYCVERLGVKRAKYVAAISDDDAAFYTHWVDKEKLQSIPQGFDEKLFNPFYEPVRNDPRIVLFCGNFKIPTNLDVVQTVYDRILKPVLAEYPRTIFRFVGGSPPTHIQHPSMQFTGFLEDYPRALQQADVVISPMKQGWGFPTKIVESLACGKTTITTPVGARALENDYETLKRVEIEDFPQAIGAAFKAASPVSQADYPKIKARYSWDALVSRLAARIDGDVP